MSSAILHTSSNIQIALRPSIHLKSSFAARLAARNRPRATPSVLHTWPRGTAALAAADALQAQREYATARAPPSSLAHQVSPPRPTLDSIRTACTPRAIFPALSLPHRLGARPARGQIPQLATGGVVEERDVARRLVAVVRRHTRQLRLSWAQVHGAAMAGSRTEAGVAVASLPAPPLRASRGDGEDEMPADSRACLRARHVLVQDDAGELDVSASAVAAKTDLPRLPRATPLGCVRSSCPRRCTSRASPRHRSSRPRDSSRLKAARKDEDAPICTTRARLATQAPRSCASPQSAGTRGWQLRALAARTAFAAAPHLLVRASKESCAHLAVSHRRLLLVVGNSN
ncbi:hypothetical protein DFH09DRAFT_1310056 [Mycena vulgaris]|nr:hypothetical protein DFH09DRAFT_1310056 [Mycena vulgaris]